MANYFNCFSEVITLITPEERAWIEEQLDEEDWEDGFPPWDPEEMMLQFEWEFSDGNFWFYSDRQDDGAGDLDQVATFVSAFLEKWRPETVVLLHWAGCCSSPKVGGFTGGLLRITRDGSESVSPGT